MIGNTPFFIPRACNSKVTGETLRYPDVIYCLRLVRPVIFLEPPILLWERARLVVWSQVFQQRMTMIPFKEKKKEWKIFCSLNLKIWNLKVYLHPHGFRPCPLRPIPMLTGPEGFRSGRFKNMDYASGDPLDTTSISCPFLLFILK